MTDQLAESGILALASAVISLVAWSNGAHFLEAIAVAMVGGFLGAFMKGAGHYVWDRVKERYNLGKRKEK